jgi:transposase
MVVDPEYPRGFEDELTVMAGEALSELYDLIHDLDRRITSFDKKDRADFSAKRALPTICEN